MVDPGPTMIDRAEWGGQVDRHLDWPGVFNVRDLGGLPAGAARLPPLYLRDGIGDQNAEVDRILRHRGTTVEAEVLATLEGFDPAAPSPVGRGSC